MPSLPLFLQGVFRLFVPAVSQDWNRVCVPAADREGEAEESRSEVSSGLRVNALLTVQVKRG